MFTAIAMWVAQLLREIVHSRSNSSTHENGFNFAVPEVVKVSGAGVQRVGKTCRRRDRLHGMRTRHVADAAEMG